MKKIIILLIIICTSLSPINAQTWSAIDTGVGGLGVGAVTVYNGNLIAAGAFFQKGPNLIYNIAQYNGITWSGMGRGLYTNPGQPLSEYALTTYNGNLIAGGQFDSAGNVRANNVAMWNGTTWSAMDSGFNYTVYALAVYNGNLYAGGQFTSAGNTLANALAEWNGSRWVPVGGGLLRASPYYVYYTAVSALTVYNGKLIVAGSFDSVSGMYVNNIAAWDGTSWSALGQGINNQVNALTVYNGNLIAGGFFDSAGGNQAKFIAQWNGTNWSSIGGGLNMSNPHNYNSVRALEVYNSDLIVGGQFDTAGGLPVNNIARWNGTSWLTFGYGIKPAAYHSGFWGIGSFTLYNSNLVAGGIFDTAGLKPAHMIAQWCDTCRALSVNENESSGLMVSLYPNPNNGVFNLSISNYQLGMNSRIEVYNVLGERVYSSQFSLLNTQISINQTSGIYLYRVISENGELVSEGKFVIEK